MKIFKTVTTVLLLSLFIISCGKKTNQGKMIPKDASVIVHLNTQSLLSKLPWEEIKASYWYQQLSTDTSVSPAAKTVINDPEKSGIDIKSDIMFFLLNQNQEQAVVTGAVKDSKVFADFIKSMHPSATFTKEGELNISKIDKAVIGWNENTFALVSDASQHKMPSMDSLSGDAPIGIPDSLKILTDSLIMVQSLPIPMDSLVASCKYLFNLKEDNSLYKDEKFADLLDEKGDVHFWMNATQLSKKSMQDMSGMGSMVKLDKFLENNISAGTINFEDGKISGTHKQYFGKELSDILKKSDGNINIDMIKRLPSGNVAAVFAMHFDPANLVNIIKLTGLDGFINLFLSSKGLTLDDLVKATKGDLLFAVTDIKVVSDTTNRLNFDTLGNSLQKTEMTFLFSLAVADRSAFNKWLELSKGLGEDLTKNTFLKTDDKYFAISNSQTAVKNYFSAASVDHPFLSKISDYPIGGYVDLQMILKAMQPQLTRDSIANAHYQKNVAMWNNIYFTGGEYKNGGLVSTGEMNLIDKTTNSLKQINRFVDDNLKIMAEKKKQNPNWRVDSASYKKPAALPSH